MKAIQITIDETLLSRLDSSPEVKKYGRSEVLRRAAAEYLKRRQKQAIAASYAAAYGDGTGLEEEFSGWEDQGQWPET